MLATLEKWLSYAGAGVGVLSGLLASVQGMGLFAVSSPPHWMAVAGTILSVAAMVIAKLLEAFSTTVQTVKGAALTAAATGK